MRERSAEGGNRRAASATALLVAAALAGCGGGSTTPGNTAGTNGAAGTAGANGAAGTPGAAGVGAAGQSGTAGAAGASGGVAGTSGAAGASGTAGASGAAGATGAAGAGTDGGAAALVLPVDRNGIYTLEFGDTKFAVDPTAGGRIVEYSLDGTNILTGPTANASYWGSTFWTAPETEWMGSSDAKAGANMMLVAAFDTLPYTMAVAADDSFTATGPNTTFDKMTMSVTKEFAANLPKGTIDIIYSLTNQGTTTMTVGHWEVTRVYPNGLTFFPAPPAASKPPLIANPSVMKVDKVGAYLWFDHSKFNPGPAPGTYGKYSTDASGGWVAHVIPDTTGAGDLLLIKTFKDIPDGTAGDGHGEVEIYAAPDRSYEEIEDHHEQATFTAGQTIPWPVRWYLRRLPKTIARTEGNMDLVNFVLAQLN
jgi:hypothetical protein